MAAAADNGCYHQRVPTLVVDTNVLVAAWMGGGGAAREVVRRCIRGDYAPVVGTTLFMEYEALLGRSSLYEGSPLDESARRMVLEAFLGACTWTRVYYTWRPNLPDEGDDHLIELALAAGAEAIVTRNLRDVAQGELKFPGLRVIDPRTCLEVFPCPR